jgi:hypothetical protein
VAPDEAVREGWRVTDLEGHLEGEALATLGSSRILVLMTVTDTTGPMQEDLGTADTQGQGGIAGGW